MRAPGTPLALTGTDAKSPPATVTSAIGGIARTGTLERPHGVAVTAAVKSPVLMAAGLRVRVVTTDPVPNVGALSVTNGGREAVMVIGSPSGSTATMFTVLVVPALRLRLAIGDIDGVWACAAASGSIKKRPRARTLDDAFMRPPRRSPHGCPKHGGKRHPDRQAA